jgi:hypothetical protein
MVKTKNYGIGMKLKKEDFDFIDQFAHETGLAKIQVIELGLDLIRSLKTKADVQTAITQSLMSRLSSRVK